MVERRKYNYEVPVRVKLSRNDNHTNTVPALYLRRRCCQQNGIDLFYFYIFSGNYSYHRSINTSHNNRKRRHHHRHQLHELPLDIQAEIITRLPAMYVMRLRSVCRDWYAMSFDPSIILEQLAHAKKVHLAIHRDDHIQEHHVHLIQSDDNNMNKVFRLKRLPKHSWRHSLKIIGSSKGILCMRELRYPQTIGVYNQSIYLYNPLLGGEYLELPKHPIIDLCPDDFYYGFCFDDVRAEFKVVIFIDDRDYRWNANVPLPLLIYTCTIPMIGEHIGTPQPWKLIKPEPDIYIDDYFDDEDFNNPLILVNGKLHLLMTGNMIISFDIASEEIESMPLHFVYDISGCLTIGELGGHLVTFCFCVNISDAILDIWVMKEYSDPESWTKQLSLRLPTFRDIIVPYIWNEDDILLLPHMYQHQMVHHTPSLLSLPSAKPVFP